MVLKDLFNFCTIHIISGLMDSKIFLVAGVMVLSIGVISMPMDSSDVKVTMSGQFVATKGCMGVVQGTLIEDYGNSTEPMCDDATKYEGKVVEVTGYVYNHKCEKGEECFGGPYMRNIESIEIII